MPTHKRPPAAALATLSTLLLVLGGCATHKTHDPAHPFSDGWRKGKVLTIGSEQSLPRTPYRDCRDDGTTRPPQTHYAHVEYRRTQLREWRVVPLPASHGLRPGDVVYVQINNCNAPVELAESSTG